MGTFNCAQARTNISPFNVELDGSSAFERLIPMTCSPCRISTRGEALYDKAQATQSLIFGPSHEGNNSTDGGRFSRTVSATEQIGFADRDKRALSGLPACPAIGLVRCLNDSKQSRPRHSEVLAHSEDHFLKLSAENPPV